MATTISTQDIIDAKRDIEDIGKAVNEKVIVSPRYGEDFKSLPMIADEFQISSDAAEAAAQSAQSSASAAEYSSNNASSSANIAEAAATAATIGAGVFETPEAGVDPVTGVADGAYYNVRSSSDESYVDEYQNLGGVATPTGKSYPSRAALNNYSKTVRNVGELRLIPASDGELVTTTYHTTEGLGSGIYRFEQLSSKTDNNGSYIASSVSAGTWILVSDNLHFEHFGVINDGTDQSAKMQSCLDYAWDAGIRLVSFEGSGLVYKYNQSIIIKPRQRSPNWQDIRDSFVVDFNGAELQPMTSGLIAFVIARDFVTFKQPSLYAKGTRTNGRSDVGSIAFYLGLPPDLESAYPPESYRWSVQSFNFESPTVQAFCEMFRFNAKFNVYYGNIVNPVACETNYMFNFANDLSGNKSQTTRLTVINPKHIGGTCTFYCNNVETLKCYGGAAEFITYPDVSGLIHDGVPTALYMPLLPTNGGVVNGYSTFSGFDIEFARRFAHLDGVQTNWTGRVYNLVDEAGTTLTTKEAYNNAFTGAFFSNIMGRANNINGDLNVQTFGGKTLDVNLVSFITNMNDISAANVNHQIKLRATDSKLSFTASGVNKASNYIAEFDTSFATVNLPRISAPTGGVLRITRKDNDISRVISLSLTDTALKLNYSDQSTAPWVQYPLELDCSKFIPAGGGKDLGESGNKRWKDLWLSGSVGFFGNTPPASKGSITGKKIPATISEQNAVLDSIVSALVAYGMVSDDRTV